MQPLTFGSVPTVQEVPSTADIEAAALVPASPEGVFDFLCDLGNHWRLVDEFVEVLELAGPPGRPPDSGLVRLRGPLGVRRTVRTHVTSKRRPGLIVGTAQLGDGTRAQVTWTLAGRPGHTSVRLAAEVERIGRFDRLLLRFGGRAWLERRFTYGLEQLAERFEVEAGEQAA